MRKEYSGKTENIPSAYTISLVSETWLSGTKFSTKSLENHQSKIQIQRDQEFQ